MSTRTHRDAYAHLALPGLRSHEQKIRDVHRGEEKKQQHGPNERAHERTRIAIPRLAERPRARAKAARAIVARILAHALLHEAREVGAGLFDRDARLESANDAQEVRTASRQFRRIESERRVRLRRAQRNPGWQHADDGALYAIELDAFADDRRI